MKNQDLKQTYDKMHAEGKKAWFDDGQTERQALFDMGAPWTGKTVMEVGCGEGGLLNMVYEAGGDVIGVDYSKNAIQTCRERYPHLSVWIGKHSDYVTSKSISLDVLLMQGVMEHLNDPFEELADMIKRFKPKTIITSMPGFLNTRGVIWHTLDMLGAVMSKTDLHFIDPWEVKRFCNKYGYSYRMTDIEEDWGSGVKMLEDLTKRIPLAIKDGRLPWDADKFFRFMTWLDTLVLHDIGVHPTKRSIIGQGAVNIYRIDL